MSNSPIFSELTKTNQKKNPFSYIPAGLEHITPIPNIIDGMPIKIKNIIIIILIEGQSLLSMNGLVWVKEECKK